MSAGEYFHSAIYWYRNNLVLGPKERTDDPGEKFEDKMFENQTDEYRTAMNNMRDHFNKQNWNEALEQFVNLPPTRNVPWN